MSDACGCVLCERCSSAPPTKLTYVGSSQAAVLASAAVALVSVAGMLLQLVRIARPCAAFHVVPNAPPAPPTPLRTPLRVNDLRRVRACAPVR